MKTIDDFMNIWRGKSAMSPLSIDELLQLEQNLAAKLPESYKYIVSTHGLVKTPNVFSKIVDLNSDITDVQDFLSLEDVASLTALYAYSGLPEGYTLFASDSQGNMYCFKQIINNISEGTDAPNDGVWLYKYGETTVTKVTDTFIDWLTTL